MFIARVSRGRTVREFIVCVVLVPTVVSIFWMAVFGGTAIQQVIADPTAALQSAPLELQLFEMLQHLPLAWLTSLLGIVLVIVFFVTSSDSGSLVIDTITRSEEHTSELQSLMRISYAVFCLKKKNT